MVLRNEDYLSNSLTYVYKPEIGQRTKYTANTGTARIATANNRLDGTGAVSTVITSAAANGTLIKTVTIKAEVAMTKGMVRLFLIDTTPTTTLVAEIEIPARSLTGTQESFALSLEVDFMLKNGWSLAASTENAEASIVTAEGLDISFP